MTVDVKREFKFKISQDMVEVYPLSKETYIATLVEKDIYKIEVINNKSARTKYYDRKQIEGFISTSYWVVINDEEM